MDMNLTRRIARAAGDLSSAAVIEVGPGPGGLTRALLETEAARVIAVERDQRFYPPLAELSAIYPDRLSVIEGDALEIDFAVLAKQSACGRVWVVANLPYNIATPLLLKWLREIGLYEGLILMFQKEVAERLTASPRTGAYGRLSVVTQWLCEASRLFDVPPGAFVPPPKVTSSVVRLTPRPVPLAPAEMSALEAVTAAAFGQRRKMLRSALKTLRVPPEELLEMAQIAPTARAEEIDPAGFCALARAYTGLVRPG